MRGFAAKSLGAITTGVGRRGSMIKQATLIWSKPANPAAILRAVKWCRNANGVTFYAESRADCAHFAEIITTLTSHCDIPVCYLTSDPADPALERTEDLFRSAYVGSGVIRTWLFQTIDCRVVVMTMPELNLYHLKRSHYPVHYVYLFHALNSTHMIYRNRAFDHYDSVLCVGPHHVRELRRSEQLYSTHGKQLIECGYPRLDRIVRESTRTNVRSTDVVVAPTWGPSSFIEKPYGPDVIEAILDAGCTTRLRLHPMTLRHHPKLPAQLLKRFQRDTRFELQLDMSETDSLMKAGLMITDWSGAGLEYFLGTGRPVIFIDLPPKINNPDYAQLGCMPIELLIRNELGTNISVGDWRSLTLCIRRAPDVVPGALEFRRHWVFHNGDSVKAAADYIRSLVR